VAVDAFCGDVIDVRTLDWKIGSSFLLDDTIVSQCETIRDTIVSAERIELPLSSATMCPSRRSNEMKVSIYLTQTRATAAGGRLPSTTDTVVTPLEEGRELLTTLTAAMPRPLSESSCQSSTTPTTTEGRREVVEKIRFQKPEIESERNTKRRKTSFILDSADKTTTNRNIILLLDGLLQFLEQKFCCKRCRKSIKTLPNKQPHPSIFPWE
jgi:hypothetical protein